MTKEINLTEWMNFIKKMNEGQPRIIDMVNKSIEQSKSKESNLNNG
ncbi:hypothetical protein [Bacillus safensis]